MLLAWKNMDSFTQHLDDMRHFRESHNHEPREVARLMKNMPVYEINLRRGKSSNDSLFNSQRKLSVVPLWEIILAKGIQN